MSLSKGGILKMDKEIQSAHIEQHPLKPFIPQHARLLMLGSFPPARKRWSMDFFYPDGFLLSKLYQRHVENLWSLLLR